MFLGLFRKKVKLVKVKRKSKAKKVVKKVVKKKIKKIKRPKTKKIKRTSKPKVTLKEVGKVTHYFPHVKAGVILVTDDTIAVGDTLQIKGHTTDFKLKVGSMQINNAPINKAVPGQEIGLLVKSRVRHNDVVYKL